MKLFGAFLVAVQAVLGVAAAEDIEDRLAFEVDSQRFVVQVHPGYDCTLAPVRVRAKNSRDAQELLKLRIRYPKKLLDFGAFSLRPKAAEASSSSRNVFLDSGFEAVQSPADVKDFARNCSVLEAQAFLDRLQFSPFKLDNRAHLPMQFSSIFYEIEVGGVGKKTYSQSVNLTEQLKFKAFGVTSALVLRPNQTFLSRVADLSESEEILGHCEVLLSASDPGKKKYLSTISAFMRNSSLMLSGKLPSDFGAGPEGSAGLAPRSLQLEVVVRERRFGYESSRLVVSLDLRTAEQVTLKEYFLVIAVVFLLCLFMCLVVLLASKSSNSQLQTVAEEMKKPTENVMLSHSVVEWKKEDHPTKPLDQTVIDELYMFKEVDQKKLRKKRIFEEDLRPPELSLSQVGKKLTLEKTMSFAIPPTSEPSSALRPNPMNETMDLSPIKRARGEDFKIRSPALTPDLASSYVSAPGLRSSLEAAGSLQLPGLASPDNQVMSGEQRPDSRLHTPAKDLRISAFSESVSPGSDQQKD